MNEKTLLIIAFLLSLGGLFFLFLLTETIDYDEKTIEQINQERIEDMIKIKGEVKRVSNVGNITFISLEQPNTIDIVIFDSVEILEGEEVEIIGKTEEYNQEMEIIAHRIRVVK